MVLTSGTRLGPYEVLSPLGVGGMGEVFRARDSRLGRDVAVKSLPEAFARDPERLARFEREAKLLASLSHANIAGIHGLEEHDGQRYLILEFVDGESLAERLGRGPLPIEEAVEVGRDIAMALEAAHLSGWTMDAVSVRRVGGRSEVYAQSFPTAGNKIRISSGGGFAGVWRADGGEIIYQSTRGVMSVLIAKGATLTPSQPRLLWAVSRDVVTMGFRSDFQRFLVGVATEDARRGSLTLLTNWTSLLGAGK